MLAASLAAGACTRAAGARLRAREKYADSSAGRWLARHAQAIREFIASLAALSQCSAQAGYRALGRARPGRRLYAAPRRIGLQAVLVFTPLVAPVFRGPAGTGLLALPARR